MVSLHIMIHKNLCSTYSSIFKICLYKYVFNKPLRYYFYTYVTYALISITMIFVTNKITIGLSSINSYLGFILNCIVNVIIVNVMLIVVFFRNKQFRYFKSLAFSFIKKYTK